MIQSTELSALAGNILHGEGGEKIGKIIDVYESTDGVDGAFVTVSTGLFGAGASFVPLAKASLQGKDVLVPYSKDLVKDAPRVDADQELTSGEEDRLYQHYSLGGPAQSAPASDREVTAGAQDDAMTRSEERLRVGTEQVRSGRARLRKRIVTEAVSTTVPVTHERPVVTSEPITDANRDKAMDGPEMTDAVHEVVLTSEQPVVSKETVPVERVRLDTQTVSEDAQVSQEVRNERIEVDGDVPSTGSAER